MRSVFASLSDGNLDALAAVLTPGARWRAVEDGPWNCHSRSAILAVMAAQHASGRLQGTIDEVVDAGERVIVAFRPAQEPQDGWPLENGVRHLVLSFENERIAEMKGCLDRASALAYARAPWPEGPANPPA